MLTQSTSLQQCMSATRKLTKAENQFLKVSE